MRRTLAVIFGALGFLVGATLIVGAIWLFNEDRDEDDFYASEAHTFEQSSYAIVSGNFDQLTEVPSWLANLLTDPVDLRIEGVADERIFIGIAPTDDVDRYLSGVAHGEVEGLDIDDRSIPVSSMRGAKAPGHRHRRGTRDFGLCPPKGSDRKRSSGRSRGEAGPRLS